MHNARNHRYSGHRPLHFEGTRCYVVTHFKPNRDKLARPPLCVSQVIPLLPPNILSVRACVRIDCMQQPNLRG
jgi:hypothetical protein